MAQSYVCLYYHIVFATKYRLPMITPEIRQRLWDYLGGLVRGEGGIPVEIGGMEEHVHLLVGLRQNVALADVLRQIKAVSSGWVHKTFPELHEFRWQTGYAAFTVSFSGIDRVREYIANQEAHHANRSFEQEFLEFLEKHEIPFNEQYLWE
ncbi:MAG: IS200/IS605 family transposase [Fimbriiglobus sp.]